MDLINKQDALNAINAVDNYGDGVAFEVLGHACRDVALLPTVEAIPISWLKDQIKIASSNGDDEYANALDWMVTKWMTEAEDESDKQG